jgi:hypothetical protein
MSFFRYALNGCAKCKYFTENQQTFHISAPARLDLAAGFVKKLLFIYFP